MAAAAYDEADDPDAVAEGDDSAFDVAGEDDSGLEDNALEDEPPAKRQRAAARNAPATPGSSAKVRSELWRNPGKCAMVGCYNER